MIKSLLGLVLTATLISANANADVKYNFYNVKEIFGNSAYALDINNVNNILIKDISTGLKLWDSKNVTDIDAELSFYELNDSNHLAGITNIQLDNGIWHTGYWNGSETFDLGSLGNKGVILWDKSDASDINNSNQIVGYSKTANSQYQAHATLWDTNTNSIIDLGTLKNGWDSIAYAINDHSQIVGYSDTKVNGLKEQHAALWQDGKVIDLGKVAGDYSSYAFDINNHNQVLGVSYGETISQLIWDISDPNNIIMQKIDNALSANSINDSGYVVGNSNDGYAFLWHDGQMTDLNQFIDPSIKAAGWHLGNASDINNNGWIIGVAHNSITGENAEFLINPYDPSDKIPPIPEPSTYLMMLAGLGLLGAYARKRNI